MTRRKRYIVAITGASGALYARRLIESLAAAGSEIYLVVSPMGRRLLRDELGMESGGALNLAALAPAADPRRIRVLPYKDVGASIASGSFKTDGMVVIPCSNNKLAELAHGLGDNLISRAAQVCLKERRRLIVVHREMPLGIIEMKNMLELAQAGATICPANPGFYTLPQSIDDLVNFVVARILDLLDVEHDLAPPLDRQKPHCRGNFLIRPIVSYSMLKAVNFMRTAYGICARYSSCFGIQSQHACAHSQAE